jgi:hypothetical protein
VRRLIVILISLNIVYFGWKVFERGAGSPPVEEVEAPARENVERLALLAEVDPGELRERVYAEPEPMASGSAPAFSEPQGRDRALPSTERTEVPSQAGTLSGDAARVAPDEPEPIAERLAAVLPAPHPLGARPPCYSVGPLTSPEEVAGVEGWLEARGGRSTLREDERRELALYWVYFAPLPDRDAADARVERLRVQGVADIYIIPRGDMANAISLGVYSRRASLERRLRELRAKGHEPLIAPRYRTKKASWFDVLFVRDFDFQASGFVDAFPAVEMSPMPCPADSLSSGDAVSPPPPPGGFARADGQAGAASAADVLGNTSAAVGRDAESRFPDPAGAGQPPRVAGGSTRSYDPEVPQPPYDDLGPAVELPRKPLANGDTRGSARP